MEEITGFVEAMKAMAEAECPGCAINDHKHPVRIERRDGAVFVYQNHQGTEHLSIFNEAQFDSLRKELNA